MEKQRYFEECIEIPEGCEIKIVNRLITIKGPKGEVTRDVKNKLLQSEIKDGKVCLFANKPSKNHKKIILTFNAHINNLFKGVTEGHVYKLKICSGHFPMSVAVKGNIFEIKNFIGESKPRLLKLKEGVTVKVNNPEIVVEGINKEVVAQTAASIESLTRRPNFDRRIFQDGIYITKKDGKKI
jgi:large subunit ribosomal protein L6